MPLAQLKPTADQTFQIVAVDDAAGLYDFGAILEQARQMERAGAVKEACDARYQAFQRIYDLLPEGEETILDWHDANTQSAVILINGTAIDHFLIGDWEMTAAMHELVLEIDPEDHLEATTRLAYIYIAMNEGDSFDEVINDVSDKYADKQILLLWSEWRRVGRLPEGNLHRFKTRFTPYYQEFIAAEHPVSEQYLADIDSERPSAEALARELWLQTEHLWLLFPDFIEALRKTQ
ncbi:MAG: tetratricopeptide repeat protein [Rikenellaceae bacterium]|jgi:hypothetical protein|nr:tetratricopeptide repeat protein [Rikenellaceae bacterium]